MDSARAIKNIHKELTTYITENDIKALILGVSGGLDSALCAVLAQPVCNFMGVPLIGRSYPIISNKDDEKKRARDVGKVFCTEFEENDLSKELSDLTVMLLGMTHDQKIRAGNVKARLRMIHLYDLAAKHRGMVLSTDNWTEFCLGFFTIYGDQGDYGMIKELWKTEVYDLTQFIAVCTPDTLKRDILLDCVQAVPTDGLGITDSDLDQIGAKDYEEVDKVLKIWMQDKETVDSYCRKSIGTHISKMHVAYTEFKKMRETYANHPVVLRHERTHFKRNHPHSIPRKTIFI